MLVGPLEGAVKMSQIAVSSTDIDERSFSKDHRTIFGHTQSKNTGSPANAGRAKPETRHATAAARASGLEMITSNPFLFL